MGRDHETPDDPARAAERGFGAETLDCAAALELIPAYLDDELSEPRAAPLRRHLLACHSCREEAQAERALQRWFVAAERAAIPADFAARVTQLAFSGSVSAPRSAIAGSTASAAPSATEARAPNAESQRLQMFVLRAVAIAAAVLLTFALVLHLRNRPSGEDLHADELPAVVEPPKPGVARPPLPANDVSKRVSSGASNAGSNAAASNTAAPSGGSASTSAALPASKTAPAADDAAKRK